ncbi:hypothetical protein V2J09_001594 [Rumex salicifolius]
MDHFLLSFLLAILSVLPLNLLAQTTTNPVSQITVEGSVYCDPCFSNDFSNFSYFMSGVDVQVQCKLKANPPGTAELITFSVNRTTNRNGVFRLQIPHIDGVDCVEGPPIQFSCQAILIRSSSSVCNVPSSRATTYQLSVKSKQANVCIYSFPGLSFRPNQRNDTLCGKRAEEVASPESLSPSRKVYLPQNFLQPRFPFPFQSRTPNQPMPFFFTPPPPPPFNLGDPRTWFPMNPFQSPPPPPMVNPFDPRTWPPLVSPPPGGPLEKKP